MTEMTTATPATDTQLDPTRRLARKVMPFIAKDSALLPPDSWIIATLKDMYKTTPAFQRDVRAAGVVAAVGLGGLVLATGGVAALAITGALTLASGAGAAVMLASTSMFAFMRGKQVWARAQSETVEVLKEEIGKRYAKYKIDEVGRAWKERRDALRASKAGGVTAPASAPAAAAPLPAKGLRDLFGRGKSSTGGDTTGNTPAPKNPPKP